MALILNIDTSVESGSVCISRDTEILAFDINENIREHAAWLHPAIQRLLNKTGLKGMDLEALAVSNGPGSYTGLRIGLSAAKGLCYAWKLPLITVGTLEMMACAINKEEADLFCPAIDARRMEIFTAVYDKSMMEIVKPMAMIVDNSSFSNLLSSNVIMFSGNGSKKLQAVLTDDHARFSTESATAVHLSKIAWRNFLQKKFADIAYAEPFYLKEFYTPFSSGN